MSFFEQCFPSPTLVNANEENNHNPVHMGSVKPGSELLLVVTPSESYNLTITDAGISVISKSVCSPSFSLSILNSSSSTSFFIPFLQIISIQCVPAGNPESGGASLSIAAVVRNHPNSRLWRVQGFVSSLEQAFTWFKQVEKFSFPEGQIPRRVTVLLNPNGGKGNAATIFKKHVQPVLTAAGCPVTLRHTGPANSPDNAKNIARTLKVEDVDVLLLISGDGTVHEIINGLASRQDAQRAFDLPIAHVAGGSGNALGVCLHGSRNVLDYIWATFVAVKGHPVPLDLCSVTQDNNRYYMFLSAAFGIMADLDLGTEHLRWMGDQRFTYGYVQGAMKRVRYRFKMLLKIAESDKRKMVHDYNGAIMNPGRSKDEHDHSRGIPDLKFGRVEDAIPKDVVIHARDEPLPETLEPGWHEFDSDIFFLYIGSSLRYVSRDTLMFPVARSDGLLDLLACNPLPSIAKALGGMDGLESGSLMFNEHARYYKCEAIRITPHETSGNAAVDGERVPYSPLQFEPHKNMARVMTVDGWFGENEPLNL